MPRLKTRVHDEGERTCAYGGASKRGCENKARNEGSQGGPKRNGAVDNATAKNDGVPWHRRWRAREKTAEDSTSVLLKKNERGKKKHHRGDGRASGATTADRGNRRGEGARQRLRHCGNLGRRQGEEERKKRCGSEHERTKGRRRSSETASRGDEKGKARSDAERERPSEIRHGREIQKEARPKGKRRSGDQNGERYAGRSTNRHDEWQHESTKNYMRRRSEKTKSSETPGLKRRAIHESTRGPKRNAVDVPRVRSRQRVCRERLRKSSRRER